MRQLLVILVTAGLTTACGTGPDEPAFASYQFYMMAFAGDTTAERSRSYDCIVTGNFTVSTPVQSSGTVHFPLHIGRTLSETRGTHREFTTADSTVNDAVLVYSGLGEAAVSISLTAGPYTLSPEPGAKVLASGEYAGPWTCGPELPLSGDSTLNAYGYDGDLEIHGTWRIAENYPID